MAPDRGGASHHRLPPPYWAFAWAGGQALARYLLDNPGAIAGSSVTDVGTGSGIAAIAAARAGAARVVACDIDPFALCASALNAALNGVEIECLRGGDGPDALFRLLPEDAPGVLLLGDVFYENALGRAMLELATRADAAGHAVYVGDPMRAYLPRDARLREVACHEVRVTRTLEDAEVRRSKVFRFCAGAP